MSGLAAPRSRAALDRTAFFEDGQRGNTAVGEPVGYAEVENLDKAFELSSAPSMYAILAWSISPLRHSGTAWVRIHGSTSVSPG